MTQITPEQTAYAEFTLTEAPDSLPTVAAYKVSADGVFGAGSGMSPTVVNVAGLSYYASAIVPADAAPGDRYSLLVTVTVGGTASVFWLGLGQVGSNALTDEQAAALERIDAKAALIGTDGALVEVVTPIGSGGEITLYSGVDYVDTAAGPLIIPVPAAVQSRVPAVDQPVYFQGRRRRTGTDYFDVAGVVIDDPDSPGSKAVSVPIPRGSIDSEFPFDDNWFYFVGDRAGSLQDAFIAGSLKLCPGPIVPA